MKKGGCMYLTCKACWVYLKAKCREEQGEFGISALLGVAIGLIVAGFVLIPGIRTFAEGIVTSMNEWWTNVVSKNVFID